MIIVVVVGVAITATVFLLIPGSQSGGPTSTNANQSTSFQSLTTITINNETITSLRSSYSNSVTFTSSSCTNLFQYPSPTFNQTITLDNSTLLLSAKQLQPITITPHDSLFLGFHLLSSPTQISGEIKSSAPINLQIVGNSNASAIFPVGSGNSLFYSKINSTDFLIQSAFPGLRAFGCGKLCYAIQE